MIALLTAGLILVAAVTALNLLLSLAIIRKLRVSPPAPAADTGEALPDVGSRVGRFEVVTTEGQTVTDATFATGHHQIIILSPSCSPCRELADRLAEDPTLAEGDAFILVSGDAEAAGPMLTELSGVRRTAYDMLDSATSALSVSGFPAVVSIQDGVVVAAEHRLTRRRPAVAV
ncbi:hypothetical protein [Hamadaea tsunoensis]|uniref:hypothetical protein n=1 Tax=Hamadaea tsunoensis TaxID=53368 RepID=UPI0003FD96EB|nr:hypothetical protein [Hamadaea tsunoensis]